MINRLIKPTSGDIFIGGENIRDKDVIQLRRGMGYVIQQTGLFSHMTCLLYTSLLGVSKTAAAGPSSCPRAFCRAEAKDSPSFK